MPTIAGREGARGQGLAEFAMVIPLFLVLLLGIVDLGRVVWANNALAQGAREAARFAIVHGGSPSTACPVGPPGPETRAPLPSADCPYPSPSKQAIVDVARSAALAGGTNVTVTVCYGPGCSGDTDVPVPPSPTASNARGTPVSVVVSSSVPLVAGGLLGLGTFAVSGSSTMLVNN